MNTVVYYPHIYPPPEWLKVAALCWDKVYRLAPPDWSNDPDSIKDLNNAFEGILVDINLKEIVDLETQKQFERWIDARGEKLKTGAQYTEVSDPRAGPIVSGKLLHSSETSVEHKAIDDLFTTIHGGKLVRKEFRELLEKHNLIQEKKNALEVQIPDWEREMEEALRREIPSEAPQMIPHPKPGSAHEAYEKLREQAWKKSVRGDAQGAQMLYEKAKQLRQQHLITVKENQDVIHLPKDIALYYLSLCASKAALKGTSDLVANGEQFTDVVFHDFRTIQGEIATSVLQAYLPQNFLTMKPKRLAEFRAEFATQRLKYEKDIQALVKEFADVASEGQLDILKKRAIDIAKERIEEKKKTYTRAHVKMVLKTVSISLTPPAFVPFIASLLGVGLFAPVGIAAALSLIAANSILDWKEAESEKKKNPWSYVLDVEKMR